MEATARVRARALPAVAGAGYLAGSLATAVTCLLAVTVVLTVLPFTLLLIGLPLVPLLVSAVRRLAGLQRLRVARYLGESVDERYRPLSGPMSTRLYNALTDPATWRDLLWLVGNALVGTVWSTFALLLPVCAGYAVSIPLWWWLVGPGKVRMLYPVDNWGEALGMMPIGLGFGLAGWLVVPAGAAVHARLTKALLAASKAADRRLLSARVEELFSSRAAALEAHGTELRRIERDLHDGTQNRLVAATMHLGIAVRALEKEASPALALVERAQQVTLDALAELRVVVRGIYPPVLAERGLEGALGALVAACPVPCRLTVRDVRRAPAAIEATAYFVVAEALTNIAKHSGAREASVVVTGTPTTLRVRIEDDGRGGADATEGSGLLGMRRRVAAGDGSMTLTSPAGGPTTIEVELPCVF